MHLAVTRVEPRAQYTLYREFDDGSKGTLDVALYLEFGVFSETTRSNCLLSCQPFFRHHRMGGWRRSRPGARLSTHAEGVGRTGIET